MEKGEYTVVRHAKGWVLSKATGETKFGRPMAIGIQTYDTQKAAREEADRLNACRAQEPADSPAREAFKVNGRIIEFGVGVEPLLSDAAYWGNRALAEHRAGNVWTARECAKAAAHALKLLMDEEFLLVAKKQGV